MKLQELTKKELLTIEGGGTINGKPLAYWVGYYGTAVLDFIINGKDEEGDIRVKFKGF